MADPGVSMCKPRESSVLIYLTSWCPYCERARQLLLSKGVLVREINIEEVPEARAEMVARSGRHTVPQIFIGETYVGGCDELHALDAAGGLDTLLNCGA
jgi:glutaredoxin 3